MKKTANDRMNERRTLEERLLRLIRQMVPTTKELKELLALQQKHMKRRERERIMGEEMISKSGDRIKDEN